MFDTNKLSGKICCDFQQLIGTVVPWYEKQNESNNLDRSSDQKRVFAAFHLKINSSLMKYTSYISSASSAGHDSLDHFLHPWSLGVQANLLACLFQCGNDLSFLAVGVGRNQLHLLNVTADGFALCHDAATVQLHSQASKTHPFTDGQEGQEHHDGSNDYSAACHFDSAIINDERMIFRMPSVEV